jgi:hypothetical protein
MADIITRIGRTCPFTGDTNYMDIPLSVGEYLRSYYKWKEEGVPIQNAFPTLNAEQREFLKTGITPERWKIIFGSEEE